MLSPAFSEVLPARAALRALLPLEQRGALVASMHWSVTPSLITIALCKKS